MLAFRRAFTFHFRISLCLPSGNDSHSHLLLARVPSHRRRKPSPEVATPPSAVREEVQQWEAVAAATGGEFPLRPPAYLNREDFQKLYSGMYFRNIISGIRYNGKKSFRKLNSRTTLPMFRNLTSETVRMRFRNLISGTSFFTQYILSEN